MYVVVRKLEKMANNQNISPNDMRKYVMSGFSIDFIGGINYVKLDDVLQRL